MRFESRVRDFIDRKTFSGKENFRITPEVQVSIAASAVQLTLGLEAWDLSYFDRVLIYPSDYQNPLTGKFHKGETNLGGFLCFSWKAFEEGNAIPHDKINLGLHEFSHALRFNGMKGHAQDYFFEHYFDRWLACAYSEFKKLKDHIPGSIFRKYGSVNIEEFFSVAVETFFETPMEFRKELPALYLHTSILLNQTFSEDGQVTIDCRKDLMKAGNFELTKDYSAAMHFRMDYNKTAIASGLSALAGIFAMIKYGGTHPLSYVFFAAAIILWIYFESQYTRVFFGKEHLKVRKGFLILKNIQTFFVPYSQLVSFKVGGAEERRGQNAGRIKSASVTYYRDSDFYRDRLHISDAQPVFDELCNELKKKNIFIAVAK